MNRLQEAIATAKTEAAKTRTAKTRTGDVVFIAIDGRGASGKSTLARLLSRDLGAEVLRTDDFAASPAPFNWYANLIEGVLDPIAAGAATLAYDRAGWWGDAPAPILDQPVTEIMIVEGVGCLAPLVRSYWDIGIFVDTPAPDCFRRGVARDLATGEPRSEIERLWRDWQAAETDYLQAVHPERNADLRLKGTEPFDAQLAL